MNIGAWGSVLISLLVAALWVVFWGFVPLALLAGNWPLAVVQIVCIGAVVIGTWRRLTYRCVKLDNRIGLSFVAYIVSTALTNLVGWLFQRGMG